MDTSFFSDINWLAVLVATIAWFALGAIWYSFLFQKSWIRYQGINMDDPGVKSGVAGVMATSFVLMFVAVAGLAILVYRLDLNLAISGVKLGLLTGICFSMTALSITYLYVKKPFGLHLIDGLYHTAGHIIAGIILCVWR